MCVSLRETRREYVHVASSSTSLSPTVSRRDTHILPPPQARRPASGACLFGACRSIDPPAWLSVVERSCPRWDCRRQDVDDKPPWMGSRRVPTWAWPFRGAHHASKGSRLPPLPAVSRPWVGSTMG